MEVQCSNLNREGDDTRPKYPCDYIILWLLEFITFFTQLVKIRLYIL